MKRQITRNTKTTKTSERQLRGVAGVWINPTWDEENQEWVAYKFSTTDGGVNFNAEINYRAIEMDNYSGFDTIGDKVAESASVTATAQIMAPTHAIYQKIMKANVSEHPSGGVELKPTKKIRRHDYIDRIGLFGQLDGGDWVIIMMENVLITSPLDIATEHNSDLTIELEMTAHIDDLAPGASFDDLPYSIILPDVMASDEDELAVVVEEGE